MNVTTEMVWITVLMVSKQTRVINVCIPCCYPFCQFGLVGWNIFAPVVGIWWFMHVV